jgi:outer membrane biosynthesis protein TonB
MNRLRIRVELNRRKAGVPMQAMVSVVEETHKFFQLLAKDVAIEADRGEWHASNFDPESLNFTAEFDGPASAEQIRAFGSAFGGATSLRRDTIAQFTRIADFIGEDELVGFGLYKSDQESEPSDWRCLSRMDAMRFADEFRLLAKDTGDSAKDPLPAVMNGSVGKRRLFKDRREREALAPDPARQIRDVESSLSRRIAVLEGELQTQARKVQTLENTPDADEKFLKMLSLMESAWAHAPQQLALSAPESPQLVPERRGSRVARGIGVAVACAALILAAAKLPQIAKFPKLFGLKRAPQSVQSALAPRAPQHTMAPLPTPPSTPQPAPAPSSGSKAQSPHTTGWTGESESAQTRRDAAPEMVSEIALDIPPDLRLKIQSEVRVKVAVSIDRFGKVKAAEVESTQGAGAIALAPEALKAARGFRFRPARQGKRNVPSQTVLTFTFNP